MIKKVQILYDPTRHESIEFPIDFTYWVKPRASAYFKTLKNTSKIVIDAIIMLSDNNLKNFEEIHDNPDRSDINDINDFILDNWESYELSEGDKIEWNSQYDLPASFPNYLFV